MEEEFLTQRPSARGVKSFRHHVTDETLMRYNKIACALHAVQGVMMLVVSQVVESIKDFKKEVTTSYLTYNDDSHSLENNTKTIFHVEIGLVSAVFLLMSAAAHGLVVIKFSTYLEHLRVETNPYRWWEYSVSSSLMICAIAMLFGCYDLGSLLLIFFVNASMCFFGHLMELLNPPDRRSTDWTPFFMGCWAGIAPWLVILLYFLGGGNFSRIPGFVYGILIGYAVFFNTFPVNMVLQYRRVGRWSEYRFGELGYIVLSLLSKSLLAWLVFGGTFQPNGDDDQS
jgi:hypothetical protein